MNRKFIESLKAKKCCMFKIHWYKNKIRENTNRYEWTGM